jgi:hypothetical protein
VSLERRKGKQQRILTYRYINDIPLKDGEHSVKVNWVELTITDEKGEIIFHNAFVTNHGITEENVAELVKAGRCRWKIENEDFNSLKTKGYHFGHNSGHGKLYFS